MLVAEEALAKTGLSKKELIIAVIYSVVFLLMLFAFVPKSHEGCKDWEYSNYEKLLLKWAACLEDHS